MKKTVLLIAVAIFSIGLFAVGVKAESRDYSAETIVSFHDDISVNADNSVDVAESIVYSTGPSEHHGIYRDIYRYSSQNKKMDISGISVVDESGNPYVFNVSNSGSYVKIQIGDPDRTFSGQKTYIIKYRASEAVAQSSDTDEIYWNVTGNEWGMPILSASATVTLPNETLAKQASCYYGPKGSTSNCSIEGGLGSVNAFRAPNTLGAGDGLTVAVGFQKGIVEPYPPISAWQDFIDKYLPWIVAGLLPILTLIFSLLYWYRYGKDPKGAGTIIPQYDVPEGLTPMEVGGIVKEKIKSDSISAEIIYLATRGYLKINQIEEKTLGFIKSTDYELVKLKDPSDLQNYFDKYLMNSLFAASHKISLSSISNVFAAPDFKDTPSSLKDSVRLSEIENTFYSNANSTIGFVADGLKSKGYYRNIFGMKSKGNGIATLIFAAIWGSIMFGGIVGSVLFEGDIVAMVVGIFLSIIVYGIVSHFFPAKTKKGVLLKEYLLGLKDYLQIAEKDRLIFHNAPEKKPEVFEKLLPFAMVLGVANIWAKEFEDIYTTPPSWYSGSNSAVFNAIVFSNSLSSFSSFASSAMVSSPRSGGLGSGGGGFSGGGGGGGGGGSW